MPRKAKRNARYKNSIGQNSTAERFLSKRKKTGKERGPNPVPVTIIARTKEREGIGGRLIEELRLTTGAMTVGRPRTIGVIVSTRKDSRLMTGAIAIAIATIGAAGTSIACEIAMTSMAIREGGTTGMTATDRGTTGEVIAAFAIDV
jgi:hypothetical protein